MSLRDLNQKYYALYDELYKARGVLTDKQFDVMAQTLLKQYVEELDICLTERLLEVGTRNFELRFRSRMYVPRHCFWGYNKIAKRLLKKYKAEFLTELKRLELDVHEEGAVHDQLDKQLGKDSTSLTVSKNNSVVSSEEK